MRTPPRRAGGSRRGSGASLSRHHSVYRALTELAEAELTHADDADRLRAIELLVDYPSLQACAAFELTTPTVSSGGTPICRYQRPVIAI
ncbi:hypothetical protein MMSP_2610 [Mycobacterium sp. 012931]|nr:hypothetical protein MMSP_2610 [Mycobacterium sp. 012931]MBC9860836.1 hypothetical protein [Mycobacterium pseudoshottsii]